MAGRIPQQFIDDLLSRLDIIDVIQPRIDLRKAGREYKACCPFHGEKTPSFTVSPTKQFYHCFGCGAHGTAISFVMEFDRLEFREAIDELAASVGMEVPVEAAPEHVRQSRDLYELMEQVARYYYQALKQQPKAIEYVKGRGLTGEIVKHFNIGFAPVGWNNLLTLHPGQDKALVETGMLIEKDDKSNYDRFRERLMFPIRDTRGKTIGFGGRVIDPEGMPKYLNSPETPLFHKGKELYGLYEARQANRSLDRVMVVEGYMDVVALAQQDITYAVATLGTATTEHHLQKLFRSTSEVIFCFDGDRAGRDAASKALDISLPFMRDGKQIRFLFLPDGEDPDSMVQSEGKEKFEARAADALTLSGYLFSLLEQDADLNSMDGRARLAELAKPYLAKLPQGVYRDLVLKELSDKTGLGEQRLEAKLDQRNDKKGQQTSSQQPRVDVSQSINAANNQPSLIRKAITLLLHHPIIGEDVHDANLIRHLNEPGSGLLADMIDVIHANPDLNTASLLSRWTNTPNHSHLTKLAFAAETEFEQAKLEFIESIQALYNRAADAELSILTNKAREEGLSAKEKNRLVELLMKKGQ